MIPSRSDTICFPCRVPSPPPAPPQAGRWLLGSGGKWVHLASRWRGEKPSFPHTFILVFLSGYLDHGNSECPFHAWQWVILLASNDKILVGFLTLISVLWATLQNCPSSVVAGIACAPEISLWLPVDLLAVVSRKVTPHPCDIFLVRSPASSISNFPHLSEEPVRVYLFLPCPTPYPPPLFLFLSSANTTHLSFSLFIRFLKMELENIYLDCSHSISSFLAVCIWAQWSPYYVSPFSPTISRGWAQRQIARKEDISNCYFSYSPCISCWLSQVYITRIKLIISLPNQLLLLISLLPLWSL